MATLRLHVEGVPVGVLAVSCTIHERIGAAFEARLHCELSSPDGHPFEAAQLLAHDARIDIEADDVARSFAGQVDSVEEDDAGTVVIVVGKAERLLRTRDHRVFVDGTALDAARTLLGEHGLSLDNKARLTPPQRVQLVQRFESDLAFVTRVLAEEGFCWVAPPDEPTTVRVLDEPGTFPDTEIHLDVLDEGGLEFGRAVHAASLEQRVLPTQVTLREYDFTRPMLELEAASGDGPLEQFEFPAGFATHDEGEALAQTRLAQRRAMHVVLRAEATEPGLRAGSVFTIDAAPVEAMTDRWLILSIRHLLRQRAGSGERAYDASLVAVPAAAGFRAAREPAVQRAPGGVCTATATGGGGEIAVDEHGRTRALLRWDRRGKTDESASTHARVLQPQLSGSIFNPRVGWEELCAFAPGADVPIALGRLYNGAQRPPTSLPAGKVETHFGTLSTPAGSGGNGLSISDTAGKEKLGIVASRDFVEHTEKDKVVKIGADHERTIDGKRELEVHERIVVAVDGDHATTVGALRRINTESNYVLSAASENVLVRGVRIFRVGGDYSTTTSNLVRIVVGKKGEVPIEHQSVFTIGASTLVVAGPLLSQVRHAVVSVGGLAVVHVAGAQTVDCEEKFSISAKGGLGEGYGPRTVKVDGAYAENYRKGTWHVKGDAKITGTEVAIEAKTKLTIKADGLTIEMTPSSIEVQGEFEGMTASVEEGNHKYG